MLAEMVVKVKQEDSEVSMPTSKNFVNKKVKVTKVIYAI